MDDIRFVPADIRTNHLSQIGLLSRSHPVSPFLLFSQEFVGFWTFLTSLVFEVILKEEILWDSSSEYWTNCFKKSNLRESVNEQKVDKMELDLLGGKWKNECGLLALPLLYLASRSCQLEIDKVYKNSTILITFGLILAQRQVLLK